MSQVLFTAILFAGMALSAMGYVSADDPVVREGKEGSQVVDAGMWPKSWPAELERLRKQSTTLIGPLVPSHSYVIPFTKRKDFESAWPYILKVKRSKQAALILVRGPDTYLDSTINAGVRIDEPPSGGEPIGLTLVVDGKIVDLRRIPLPSGITIYDKRFEDGQTKR